jgi:hypothetical protein
MIYGSSALFPFLSHLRGTESKKTEAKSRTWRMGLPRFVDFGTGR